MALAIFGERALCRDRLCVIQNLLLFEKLIEVRSKASSVE